MSRVLSFPFFFPACGKGEGRGGGTPVLAGKGQREVRAPPEIEQPRWPKPLLEDPGRSLSRAGCHLPHLPRTATPYTKEASCCPFAPAVPPVPNPNLSSKLAFEIICWDSCDILSRYRHPTPSPTHATDVPLHSLAPAPPNSQTQHKGAHGNAINGAVMACEVRPICNNA